MSKGVLLIAIGHPYYTHMAYNLALSIRSHSDIDITLAHEGAGLSFLLPEQKKIFSNLIEVPEEMFTENGKRENIKVKTFIYDLSPYDKTIFLDADMIFSPYKKIENLFEEMGEKKIQFGCRGEKEMTDENAEWVKMIEVKEKHLFNHWYELSSEFIYFEKCVAIKYFFEDAKMYYTHHNLSVTTFAGGTPDEVPFGLALEKNNINITSPFAPTYWQPQHFNKITPDIDVMNNYYAISTGGAYVQPNIKRMYDNLTKHYYRIMKLIGTPYQLIAKANLIPERRKI